MNHQQMKAAVEGLLFVAGDEGLEVRQLAEVLQVDPAFARELLVDLQAELTRQGRGIQVVEIAGSFQLATLPVHAVYFERLAYSPSRATLSQAAMETLSIVTYRQPITRIDIEEIRGVKTDRALHTLLAKELIEEIGRAEAIGRPILYGTTRQFLDYFGLRSLADLPESSTFESELLEEDTKLLFAKLDSRQMTFDDIGNGEANARTKADEDGRSAVEHNGTGAEDALDEAGESEAVRREQR